MARIKIMMPKSWAKDIAKKTNRSVWSVREIIRNERYTETDVWNLYLDMRKEIVEVIKKKEELI